MTKDQALSNYSEKILSMNAQYKGIAGVVSPGVGGISAEGMGFNTSTETVLKLKDAAIRLIKASKDQQQLDDITKEIEGLLMNATTIGFLSDVDSRKLIDELQDITGVRNGA